MKPRTGRRPRGLALTFPPGFLELTSNGHARTALLEHDLDAAYPRMNRSDRELVLGLLTTPEVTQRLAETPASHRTALGLVQVHDELAGVVVLAATATISPDGPAGELADDLAIALDGRTDIRLEPLSTARVTGALVWHPERTRLTPIPVVSRADLYLTDRTSDVVTVVSCMSIGTPASVIAPLMHNIAANSHPV